MSDLWILLIFKCSSIFPGTCGGLKLDHFIQGFKSAESCSEMAEFERVTADQSTVMFCVNGFLGK